MNGFSVLRRKSPFKVFRLNRLAQGALFRSVCNTLLLYINRRKSRWLLFRPTIIIPPTTRRCPVEISATRQDPPLSIDCSNIVKIDDGPCARSQQVVNWGWTRAILLIEIPGLQIVRTINWWECNRMHQQSTIYGIGNSMTTRSSVYYDGPR